MSIEETIANAIEFRISHLKRLLLSAMMETSVHRLDWMHEITTLQDWLKTKLPKAS